MATEEKVAVVERVSEQLTDAAATLLTDYRGLSVAELAELRAELRKVDATYAVVKNTLTRLAAEQAGMAEINDLLVGPTAIVFCGEDPVGPAKALRAFAKGHEQLSVKGGFLDGEVLDAESAEKLADLASRDELLATLAGMMNNALAGFARLLQAPISDMARLVAALEEDGGVEARGFTPTAPVGTPVDTPGGDEDTTDEDTTDAAAGDEAADDAAAVDADSVSSASSDSSDSDDSPDEGDDGEDEATGDDATDENATDAATDDDSPDDDDEDVTDEPDDE